MVQDEQAFLHALLSTGRFGVDRAVGRMFHRGSISLREVSSKSGLHLSFNRDRGVDVHVDIVPPVVGTTPDGKCRYGVGRVSAHLRHDVVTIVLRRSRQKAATSFARSKMARWTYPHGVSFSLPSASVFIGALDQYAATIRLGAALQAQAALPSARRFLQPLCETSSRTTACKYLLGPPVQSR